MEANEFLGSLLFVNGDTLQVLSVWLSTYLFDEDESDFERAKTKTHNTEMTDTLNNFVIEKQQIGMSEYFLLGTGVSPFCCL